MPYHAYFDALPKILLMPYHAYFDALPKIQAQILLQQTLKSLINFTTSI